MRDSSLWTVATGTLVVSLASTCITGLYAAFSRKHKRLNHAQLVAASAFNSAVTAAAFFSIREYIISPVRAHVAADISSSGGVGGKNERELSWSNLRTHNLIDSGISGAATGGMLRGLTSGRRAIVPAALTAGTVCVLLQRSYNELRVQRIKYVGQLSEQPASKIVVETDELPLKTRVLEALGVRQLTDEQMLQRFRREREKHLERIRKLEAEIQEDGKKDDKK